MQILLKPFFPTIRLGVSHVCSTLLVEALSTGPSEKLGFHTGIPVLCLCVPVLVCYACLTMPVLCLCYANLFTPFSYGMELRDTGNYGFILPPDQIIPTGEEVWAFHMTVAREIIQEFGMP